MTLIFINHTYKYETESLVKMFFPCDRFEHEYNSKDLDRDDIIVTRVKKGRKHYFLLAVVKLNSKIAYFHTKLSVNSENLEFELQRMLAIALYNALKEITAFDSKWGIMTGIRPVKNMNFYIKHGKTLDEAKEIFSKDFLVSEQKIKLCEKTLKNQTDIIKISNDNSYSLYISIPFCPSRCSYCSFVSHSIANDKAAKIVEDYIIKLIEELKFISNQAGLLNLNLETVYIGGGTPVALSAEQLKLLCDAVKEYFPLDKVREYTIEAGRADAITLEKLKVIKNSGANRISINPQSFNDEVLKAIGRRHTAKDVYNAFNMAKSVGLNEINMDFIAGLPNDTLDSFKMSIDKAIALDPCNITVHTLTIKRSSDLYFGLKQGLPQESIADMVNYAYKALTDNGYEPYYLYRQKNTLQNLENVGYAKKGYECLYNIFMMEEVHTVLAAGAGSVSKLILKDSGVERIFNYKYPFEYIKRFDNVPERKKAVYDFYKTYNNC